MIQPPPEDSPLTLRLKIAAVVGAYFTVSICLVFSNKVLLSSAGATIPAPLFVTWFQCVLTAIIIYLLGWVAQGAEADSFIKKEMPSKKPGQRHAEDDNATRRTEHRWNNLKSRSNFH